MRNNEHFDAPELPVYFDEAGRQCAVDWPQDDEPEPPQSAPSLSGVLSILLTATNSSAEIGNRALFLGYVMRTPGAPRTLRELGARMGISHVMAAKRLTRFKGDLRAILRENGLNG